MVDIKTVRKKSVHQHDSSDCGAACLVSVINYFGGSSTIERIRKLSGTGPSGTTLLGLYQAARQSGLDASGYEADIEDIIGYEGTLILHVTLVNGQEHYIVNFGFENGRFIIWDPAKGLEYISREDLEKKWISKKCLGLRPGMSFMPEKEKKHKKREWLLKIIKPDLQLLTISVIAGIIIAGLGLVMAIFTQKLVDEILPSKNTRLLIIALILVFILLAARIIIGFIRQMLLISQGRSFNIRIVDDFFGTLLFLPRAFFDSRKTGDFVGRLNDTIRIQRVITEFVNTYIIDFLVVVISLIILFIYSEAVALFTLLVLPLLFILVYRKNTRIISAQRDVMFSYANSESNYIDSIRGINEIKGLNWQNFFREKNKMIFSDFQGKSFHLGKIKITIGLLTGLTGTIYLMLVLFYSSVGVMRSWMTQGELLAVLTICSNLLPSSLNLALIAIPLSEVKVAISRMFEFTQEEPEESLLEDEEHDIQFNEIKLENISYRFPGRRLLLKDINIVLKKGQVISMVGESGCGKSTLINLIMRFYKPETGHIIINGCHNSDDILLEKWRSSIGIIPQEIHIFNGTILQNLLSDFSEDNMIRLLSMIKEFGLGPFFDSFPSGLMTLVGEEGLNLSGGQKQLIGFMRALYTVPDFLLIDEGTSNLDNETEKIIIDLISRIKKQKGIFMVSHKVNLLRKISDRIYVLGDGTITGGGLHEELLVASDSYKKFWDNIY